MLKHGGIAVKVHGTASVRDFVLFWFLNQKSGLAPASLSLRTTPAYHPLIAVLPITASPHPAALSPAHIPPTMVCHAR